MRIPTPSLFVTVMALLSASCLYADDNDALKELPQRHAKCWGAHDAGAMAELYTADADHVSSLGVYTQGRETIRKRYAAAFSRDRLKNSQHVVLETKARKIAGDVGVVDVLWKMTGVIDEGGKPVENVQGRYCMVAVMNEGTWKIALLRAMIPDNAYQAGIKRGAVKPKLLVPDAAPRAVEVEGVAELKDIPNKQASLWAAKDADGLANLFASDADHVSSLGTFTTGREALRQGYTAVFAQARLKNVKHDNTSTSIRPLTETVAVIDCTWVMTGAVDDAGKAIEKIDGRSTMIATRKDGKWLITALRAMIPDNASHAGIEKEDK